VATTYSTPDAPVRVTLSATPDNATRFDFEDHIRRVEVQFLDASNNALAGKVARTGTDNAAISASYIFVPAGTKEEIVITGRDRTVVLGGFSLYIASPTASAIAEVTGYRR
jgi:hypothetical protein